MAGDENMSAMRQIGKRMADHIAKSGVGYVAKPAPIAQLLPIAGYAGRN
jgi:hypothetical protein